MLAITIKGNLNDRLKYIVRNLSFLICVLNAMERRWEKEKQRCGSKMPHTHCSRATIILTAKSTTIIVIIKSERKKAMALQSVFNSTSTSSATAVTIHLFIETSMSCKNNKSINTAIFFLLQKRKEMFLFPE